MDLNLLYFRGFRGFTATHKYLDESDKSAGQLTRCNRMYITVFQSFPQPTTSGTLSAL